MGKYFTWKSLFWFLSGKEGSKVRAQNTQLANISLKTSLNNLRSNISRTVRRKNLLIIASRLCNCSAFLKFQLWHTTYRFDIKSEAMILFNQLIIKFCLWLIKSIFRSRLTKLKMFINYENSMFQLIAALFYTGCVIQVREVFLT